MSALSDAITRSFSAGELERPAVSPLRDLGRRRLSGIEVLAQSVATTAPAASMVVLPMTVLLTILTTGAAILATYLGSATLTLHGNGDPVLVGTRRPPGGAPRPGPGAH